MTSVTNFLILIIASLYLLFFLDHTCGTHLPSELLNRSRRQLLFPNSTLLQLNGGLGTPTPRDKVFVNWAFQANFQLPWNRSQIPVDILETDAAYLGTSRMKREVENRYNEYENDARLYHFYKYVQEVLNGSQEETSRRRRVTFQQLETLWEFLNAHKDISVGYNKSAQAREYSRRMWVSVSEALNSQGEGATKDWKGWSNYWVDYKAKLKKRAAALRTSQRRTGGGPSDVAPLSEIEKKFLSLLGDGFGIGLPNTQVDPFPVLPQFSADMDIEPEAGTSSNLIAETVTNIERQGFELVVDEEAQSQPAHPTTALPEHEVVVPSGSTILQGAQNVGARRNRQPILSQDAARRIMVDIAKSRLELEKKNNQALQEMLQTQKQSLLVWQEISQTLSRLEAKIDRFGHNGTACVLRALCQLGSEPLHSDDEEDLLHELASFVLNPNNDAEYTAYKEEIQPYIDAFESGKQFQNCSTLYQNCSISLVDLFSKPHTT